MNPLVVACPYCHAKPGEYCRLRGRGTTPHAARWNAARKVAA